jgi:Co/Zn/Cd efflux system component
MSAMLLWAAVLSLEFSRARICFFLEQLWNVNATYISWAIALIESIAVICAMLLIWMFNKSGFDLKLVKRDKK